MDIRPVGMNPTARPYVALTTNLTFAEVRVKRGSITEQEWIDTLKQRTQLGYATEGFIIGDTVPYVKIGTLALSIEGTIIYDDFKVNGTTSNIPIPFNQTPILGTVTITSFVEV